MPRPASSPGPRRTTVTAVLAWMRAKGTARNRAGMARYGIVAAKVFGLSVANLRAYAKRIGIDHTLAAALWKTGWYEARLLAAFVDDPALVTVAQMDAWCRGFENWADCDTTCFHLFDQVPHAWGRITAWSRRRSEFEKRAAFALLASVAAHRRDEPDAKFLKALALVERESGDARNFVKKAVSWALRTIGNRSAECHAAAIALSRRLAESDVPSARWIGKDALRDLQRPLVLARVARRAR